MKDIRETPLEENNEDRLQRERSHFNVVAQKMSRSTSLKMPVDNIRRYHSPPENTPYALEYAFSLLAI